MCYTELFETVNINIKLIKLVGLETAAYWSVLQEVLPKVKAKKTYDPATGFFPLKREYVTEKIGLPIESQYKCDKALADLGLLKVDPEDPDRISANVKGLVALIVDEDPDTLAKAATVGKKASKAYRRECQIAALRKCITEKDPAVADKLSEWVSSVFGSTRLTKAIVQTFVSKLDSYTASTAIKLKLVEIATVRNYANFDWVAGIYEKDMRATIGKSSLFEGLVPEVDNAPTEVNKDIAF